MFDPASEASNGSTFAHGENTELVLTVLPFADIFAAPRGGGSG